MTSIIFPAKEETLYEVLEFVENFALAHGFSKEWIQIELAVEEIFVNIASYAYGEGKEGSVEIICKVEEGKILISFIDKGIPYNPLKCPDPDILAPIEKREIGGLGIFFAKECMDRTLYKHCEGKNILTMEKNLESE